jgi:acetyl esterase/lipase
MNMVGRSFPIYPAAHILRQTMGRKMMKRSNKRFLSALLVSAVLIAPAIAAPGPFRQMLSGRMAAKLAEPPAPGAKSYAYGPDPLQTLDLWRPTGHAPAPLIIFVHGGGWTRGDKDNATGAAKVNHLLGRGFAVASIDYRLVPAATVEQQAADVALALSWLRAHAAAYGVDPDRIVLMGHSAGAHLVALVGTDPFYLAAVGLDYRALRGVVPIDGAAYDVPKQIADAGSFMHDTYVQAFGADPARQNRLSPTLQAAAPNAPAFLLLHVSRPDGVAQAKALADALTAAGTAVERRQFDGTGLRGHMVINRSLGDPAYPATAVLDAWLDRVLR